MGSTQVRGLQAGVNIIQKAVFHLDNVNAGCDEDDIVDFLKSSDIQVVSCFSCKSWLRSDNERNAVTSFRVTVVASDKEKF